MHELITPPVITALSLAKTPNEFLALTLIFPAVYNSPSTNNAAVSPNDLLWVTLITESDAKFAFFCTHNLPLVISILVPDS